MSRSAAPGTCEHLVQRAVKGARLQPAELLQVLDMITAARNLRRAFLRLPDVETRFPHLREFADHLAELPDLEADINRSIGPRGDVLDTASAELGRIRRDVRVAHSRLMERLNALVSGGKYASVLQDSIVTTRDGRYVVPVRADARAQLQGVVHDTSASGQTLFVEPFEIVELNNRWRERQLDEQHEIDRILDALSDRIGGRADEISSSVEATAAIDLAMAKARLAFTMRAHRPTLWSDERFRSERSRNAPHLATSGASPATRSGGGRPDRRRTRCGIPSLAHHRTEHGWKDGRVKDDRPLDAHGADGPVRSGRRHVCCLCLSCRLHRRR